MSDYLTQSQAATELGIAPRKIQDLYYQGYLTADIFVVIGGRRFIPRVKMAEIAAILAKLSKRRKRLKPQGQTS